MQDAGAYQRLLDTAARVDVESGPREAPTLQRRPAKHDAKEAQARLVRGAHPFEPHDEIRRSQLRMAGLVQAGLGAGGVVVRRGVLHHV